MRPAHAATADRLGYCQRLCVAARRRDKPEEHRTLVGSPASGGLTMITIAFEPA
jgi:hypothetical protein